MSYEKLKNNGEQGEILSEDHQKLCRMCGDLKRVGAPKNFDFHLKARIANANPNDFQPNPFLPFLRYALPLCVVLLLAGFVVFSGILTNDQSQTVAESPSPTSETTTAPVNSEKTIAAIIPTAAASNTVSPSANAETPKTISNVQVIPVANKISSVDFASKNAASKTEDFGGTRVSASRDSKILTPRGIPSIQPPANSQSTGMGSRNSISVKSALSGIGIEAEFVSPNWKVKSVAPNSLAMRSGVKNGDLIESADDRKLDSETISEQSLTIRTLHVIREGKKIIVELR